MPNKVTSNQIATLAAIVLQHPKSSHIAKKLAASALSQKSDRKRTSVKLAILAAVVLRGEQYSQTDKRLAASVLTQKVMVFA